MAFFFICTRVYGQTEFVQFIKFEGKNLSFEQVIEGFELRLKVFIQYDALLVSEYRKFDINYQNIRGKQALEDFLAKSGLTFTVNGNQVILKKIIRPKEVKQFLLSGRISQKNSGEFISVARIQNLTSGISVYSTEAGYFTLFLKTDTNIIRVYFPGFEVYRDTVFGDRDYFVNYEMDLSPETMPVAEIGVKTGVKNPVVKDGQSDHYFINKNKIRQLPHLLGEPDVIRIMSLFPGVVGGSEGMLGMYIRGGASDQNLVLLDDVPVFNSFHLYGVFSIFNDEVVKSANLLKGGFPARYGGRLSSVVNVQSKEGNNYRIKGSFSIGLLAAKAFIEGPLIKNRTTFTLAFRRSYVDFLTRPAVRLFFSNDSLKNNVYYFWDLNARVTHRFNNRSRLTLSFYTGKDVGGIDEKSNTKKNGLEIIERRQQLASWGNLVGSAKWNYYPGSKTGITIKAHITAYNYSFSQNYSLKKDTTGKKGLLVDDFTKYVLKNGIMDQEASALITHKFSPYVSFNGGGGFVRHSFTPGNRSLNSRIAGNESEIQFNDAKVNTPEAYAFIEANFIVKKKLYADIGLRNSWYLLAKQFYYVLPEPRINLRYKISSKTWLKLSGMRTWQFFHLLTNLSLGLPSDLWVPSSTNFKPSLSDQASLGVTHSENIWQISSEIFYKKLNYLLEYKDNAGYVTSAANWENAVTSGSGEAYGWEIMAEKTKGRLTGWVSYAWMFNNRNFKDLNNGHTFPARYDRRHNVYIASVYRIKNGIDFSAAWTFNTGFAITTPIGKYQSPTANDPYREIFIYGNRNNYRTLANHRLDLAFNFEKQKKYYTRIWSVGLFNAYNRQNPFYINIGFDSQGNRILYQVSLLPIMPNVSFKINF